MNFAQFSKVYPCLGRLFEFGSNVDLPTVLLGDNTMYGILEVQASRLSDEDMVTMHNLNDPRIGDIVNKKCIWLLDDWLTLISTGE